MLSTAPGHKEAKNHQDFDADGTGREQGHLLRVIFDFGGSLLDRWCSSSLALFPSAILKLSRSLGNLFYLF